MPIAFCSGLFAKQKLVNWSDALSAEPFHGYAVMALLGYLCGPPMALGAGIHTRLVAPFTTGSYSMVSVSARGHVFGIGRLGRARYAGMR